MKRYSVIIIFPLLIALAYAPINIPFTLDSVARITPARQWVLTQTVDGSLGAVFYDHLTGMVRKQEGYQFDRGDMVQMRFQDGWKTGTLIKRGDTVATITSNRLSEQLVQLKNQLAVEQANLGAVASGQKPQVIAQLEEEISLAKSDVELRQKTLDRNKQLFADGLIAALAIEQAENAVAEAQARVRLAEKSLAISASGEKQETVAVTSSRIDSLQKQIEFLEQKGSRYTIAAPFDGTVRLENTLEGNRLLIEDASAVVMELPVRLRDLPYVQAGQTITVQFPNQAENITARVLEIGKRVELISYEQVVTVKVAVDKWQGFISASAPLQCRILCGEVRLLEFLRRSVRWQM